MTLSQIVGGFQQAFHLHQEFCSTYLWVVLLDVGVDGLCCADHKPGNRPKASSISIEAQQQDSESGKEHMPLLALLPSRGSARIHRCQESQCRVIESIADSFKSKGNEN
jgi:hypothetical protein